MIIGNDQLPQPSGLNLTPVQDFPGEPSGTKLVGEHVVSDLIGRDQADADGIADRPSDVVDVQTLH